MNTESIECRFNRANLLATSNSTEDVEEAKSIYLEVIKIEPTHLGAWNNLGRLLFENGYKSAAQTAFTAAVTYHPHEAAAHVNLGNVLLDMNDLSTAENHFKIALNLSPDLTNAHQGLASIMHRLGKEDESHYHREMGFGKQHLSTLPYRGRGEPVQLLVLASALEGNIPWRLLIDCEVFQTTIIAVEYFDSQLPLPIHQVIFNAIGDADLCKSGLEIARKLIESTLAPVINRPEAVLQTGRLMNARRMGDIPDVIAPNMALISKTDMISGQALKILAHNKIAFPLLLRATSFHGGNYFICIESVDELNSAFEGLPGENLLAIEFMDSCSDDHLFRKYRVMSINGSLYPIHMAISAQWKVHYFSSDMDNDKYRDEEKVFLNDFPSFLGPNAVSALEKIVTTIGLEYCGIDFGMDKKGSVLLYEANSTMAIVLPSNDKRWDYKRATIENAIAAVKRMFVERVPSPIITI